MLPAVSKTRDTRGELRPRHLADARISLSPPPDYWAGRWSPVWGIFVEDRRFRRELLDEFRDAFCGAATVEVIGHAHDFDLRCSDLDAWVGFSAHARADASGRHIGSANNPYGRS